MRPVYCAVALVALACLLIRASRVGMAGDPNEALRTQSAIQMARDGDWLRPALHEPPLATVLAGVSARILGISRLTLRLPGVLLAGLAAGLVFWWAAEFESWQAGLCAAALLVSNHLWHSVASLCTAEGLAVSFYILALFCLFADPWLDSMWSLWGFAGAVAGGLLTKGAVGLIPLAVLGLYWLAAPRNYRARLGRAMVAGALAVALAAPWFVYQAMAHPRWFQAGGTPQASNGLFYLTRLLFQDPILFAIAAVALPNLVKDLRRRFAPAILLSLGLALPAAALAWGGQNAAYLLPLVPMMAILAAVYNPLCSGRGARWMLAVLAAVFVAKAAAPEAPWGLPFQEGITVAEAPLLSGSCERARSQASPRQERLRYPL